LYGNASTNGGGARIIGGRTEFYGLKHVRINAGTNKTLMMGHRFVGGPSTDWVSDSGTNTFRMDVDSQVRATPTALQMLNNIGITMQDTGGTDRTVLKMANNDTVQFGTSSANGNYAAGTWNFQANQVLTRTAPTYGASVAINAALGNLFDVTATNGT